MDNGNDIYNYNYDPIGNRNRAVTNAVATDYEANGLNQYTNILNSQFSIIHSHDLDGNMTYDGSTWHHSWDGENRLIKSEPHNATNGSVMVECKYNYKNLRVSKTVKQLSGRGSGYPMDPSGVGTWDTVKEHRYIWDGYNIIAEHVTDLASSAVSTNLYTWGLDLSGTIQGAGGVGGLLCETKTTSSATNTYFALSDANGNITEYVDEDGAVKAHIEYSATGEETDKSGTMKDAFTHRFSTKPYDPDTRLVQYEQRPYDPVFSRWLSRDPIGIEGGLNEVGFVNNDGVNGVDAFGLIDKDIIDIRMKTGIHSTDMVPNSKTTEFIEIWVQLADDFPKNCYINFIQMYRVKHEYSDGSYAGHTKWTFDNKKSGFQEFYYKRAEVPIIKAGGMTSAVFYDSPGGSFPGFSRLKPGVKPPKGKSYTRGDYYESSKDSLFEAVVGVFKVCLCEKKDKQGMPIQNEDGEQLHVSIADYIDSREWTRDPGKGKYTYTDTSFGKAQFKKIYLEAKRHERK